MDDADGLKGRIAASPGLARVLNLLMEEPRTPGGIASALSIKPATASNHLATLHALGLVSGSAHGRTRLYSTRPGVRSDFIPTITSLPDGQQGLDKPATTNPAEEEPDS